MEAKDFLDNKIEVGSSVIFAQLGYRNLMKGKIKSISEKNVMIEHEKTNTNRITITKQLHNQVIVFNPNLENLRSLIDSYKEDKVLQRIREIQSVPLKVNIIEEQFLTYELSFKFKELGFKKECFGYYESQDKNLVINYDNTIKLTEEQKKRPLLYQQEVTNLNLPQWAIAAPLWQQAIDWLREEKYIEIILFPEQVSENKLRSSGRIIINANYSDTNLNDYYITREQAIKKAIEIMTGKKQ